jgi:K+/H+ antiporter YhaU regulatory subunit KhtT
MSIATDLATRIARGEFKEQQKLLGRSSLAGRYNVSPETIRRALSLLQEKGILDVIPGTGVLVTSKEAAEVYLTQVSQHQALQEIQQRLSNLIEERNRLDTEIGKMMEELLNYTFKFFTRMQKIQEYKIPVDSGIVGKTLENSEFRGKTGATVLAVEKNGETIYSPPPHTELNAGDVLVIIGPPDTKNLIAKLIQG